MDKRRWQEVERPLTETPEGQELYDLLLGNIERRSIEGEALRKVDIKTTEGFTI